MLEELYQTGKLNLIAVDEAHTIADWGDSYFRPAILKLRELKEKFPRVPLVALTATASKEKMERVMTMLAMPAPGQPRGTITFRLGLNRSNLIYSVRKKINRPRDPRMPHVLQPTGAEKDDTANADAVVSGDRAESVAANVAEQSYGEHSKKQFGRDVDSQILRIITEVECGHVGIIYCRTRAECDRMALYLHGNDVKAVRYHGSMKEDDKKTSQEKWVKEDAKIVVATNAFGLGIDKHNGTCDHSL